jgi:hypothetical protein
MTEELNEGVAYLKALKSAGVGVHSAAATAPARVNAAFSRASMAEATPAENPHGSDKRRSARYKCDGSAQIREEGCDVHTWASFTDISLHGCYVEAQATYPAGTGLDLKLEVNGIRVETKGKVQISYPYLGMGIAFVDTSADDIVRLKQLLATISHSSMIMGPGIASSLPATDPLKTVPVTNPAAAVEALMEFFESHQMLLRDDFLRLLRKTQSPDLQR